MISKRMGGYSAREREKERKRGLEEAKKRERKGPRDSKKKEKIDE